MAKKASEHFKRYQNPEGPAISTVSRRIIEKDGLFDNEYGREAYDRAINGNYYELNFGLSY